MFCLDIDLNGFHLIYLIHEMLADDHGEGVHNHLCPYITIILRGGYWETTKKGKFWRRPRLYWISFCKCSS